MKIRILNVSLIIAVFGLTACSFVNKQNDITTVTSKLKTTSLGEEVSSTVYYGYDFSRTKKSKEKLDLIYFVGGDYEHSITKEKLQKAMTLGDIIDYYPSNWIVEYSSVEVLTIKKGIKKKVLSENDVLNTEQKKMLNAVNLTDVVIIKVNYKKKNPVTDKLHDSQMEVAMTVVPEKEAAFVGGYDAMIQYLKENTKVKISHWNFEIFQRVSIGFTINEKGEAANTVVTKTSGSFEIDKLLVELISKMPKWNPAKNIEDIPVQQEFAFNIGSNRDGC